MRCFFLHVCLSSAFASHGLRAHRANLMQNESSEHVTEDWSALTHGGTTPKATPRFLRALQNLFLVLNPAIACRPHALNVGRSRPCALNGKPSARISRIPATFTSNRAENYTDNRYRTYTKRIPDRVEQSSSNLLGRLEQTIRKHQSLAGLVDVETLEIKAAVKRITLVLRACIRALGYEHSLSLQCMDQLAGLLEKQDDLEIAEKLYKKMLEVKTAQYGSDHPDTLQTKNDLARLYEARGNTEGAAELIKELLQAWNALDRDTHTAFPYYQSQTCDYHLTGEWLARTLQRCGYAEKGLAIHKQVLERLTDQMGAKSEKVLWSRLRFNYFLHDSGYSKQAFQEHEKLSHLAKYEGGELPGRSKKALARAMVAKGNLDDAITLQLQIFEDRQAKYAPKDLNVLWSKFEVAQTLHERGELKQAEKLMRECINVGIEAYGENHKDIQKFKSLMASVLESRGKVNEAVKLWEEMVEFWNRTAGPEHPQTLWSTMRLAKFCKTDSAIGMAKHVVEIRERKLGPDHRDTIISKEKFAEILNNFGRHFEAQSLQSQVVDVRKRTLGPHHTRTLYSMKNLGSTLARLKDYAGCGELRRAVFEARRELNGPDHPETLAAKLDWATNFRFLGKFDVAASMFREVLDARILKLGPEHKLTLWARNSLVACLTLKGDLDEAERLGRENVAARIRILGPEHQDTLTSKLVLSKALHDGKDYNRALELKRQVVEGRQRKLGNGHFKTKEAIRSLSLTKRLMEQSRAVTNAITQIEPAHIRKTASAAIWQAKGWNEFDSSFKMLPPPSPELVDFLENFDDLGDVPDVQHPSQTGPLFGGI